MYERNAIILERYFDKMFGYNLKNNIKTNFLNYCDLIDVSEKYKNITEEEEEIIIEYDIIANRIREIQKAQEELKKKNEKLQSQREELFENIDEDSDSIQKKFEEVNDDIVNLDNEIKENAMKFVNVIAEFNDKTLNRNKCGKNRRETEAEYNRILNNTLDNYRNIDVNVINKAKQFPESDTTAIEKELKKIMQENGEKEKIPFNKEVIEQAIKLSIDIQRKETEILANAYEKTNKVFIEIKNNKLKLDLHRRIIVDSKSKQEFVLAIKEYLVEFLDNERLASVNGEDEYNKLMKEACKNLNSDLVQINNLYTLLVKEISRKITKKSYIELYKIEYLKDLKKKAEEFENEIKKLRLPVAIINPNYWRVEGMKKIYDVFHKCVTENYGRDLSEFMPLDDDSDSSDADDEEKASNIRINNEKENNHNNKLKELNSDKGEENKEDEKKEQDSVKSEIDRKIDMILGLNSENQIKKHTGNNSEQTDVEEQDDDIDEDIEYGEKEVDEDDYDELESIDNDEWDEENEDFQDNEDEEQDEYDDNDNSEFDFQEKKNYNADDDDEWDEEEFEYDDETDEDDANRKVDLENETEDYEDDEEIFEDYEDEDIDNDKFNSELMETKKSNRNMKKKNNKQKKLDREEFDEYEDNFEIQDNELEDVDYDIWGNTISKKSKEKDKKKNKNNEGADWGNEFINIDKKEKKKKGFFNKFIK